MTGMGKILHENIPWNILVFKPCATVGLKFTGLSCQCGMVQDELTHLTVGLTVSWSRMGSRVTHGLHGSKNIMKKSWWKSGFKVTIVYVYYILVSTYGTDLSWFWSYSRCDVYMRNRVIKLPAYMILLVSRFLIIWNNEGGSECSNLACHLCTEWLTNINPVESEVKPGEGADMPQYPSSTWSIPASILGFSNTEYSTLLHVYLTVIPKNRPPPGYQFYRD